ncbi:hypothetical protein D1B31_21990 [Neobacillus notoginsengisoli]|uniref:Uncharacterized protein n=1 Tax=Neobacillus notoginsengisoli TaxID=1578198 RepID=A0A417YFF5_9BACI|nr:hypothetical protein [Neobacillus notoginsengisoli]RHW31482.1 hypothetical protein D1B31_21990 [Neobacillus notoginsengisoli]
MYTVLTYFVILLVIVVSAFVTLFFKNELERMFQEKNVAAFHICNVLIVLMVAFGAHTVMTIYMMGSKINLFLQLAILLFMVLPVYVAGHLAFEKYKAVYRKYNTAEDGKVIVLNEKYLKKKKRFTKLKNYNALSKED